jgi:hypothetical protein
MDRWRERQTDRGVGSDNGLDLREDDFCQSISFPLPFDELHVSVPTVAETVGLSIDLVWRHFGRWPTHCRVSASCFAARGAGDAHWDCGLCAMDHNGPELVVALGLLGLVLAVTVRAGSGSTT